MKTLAYITVVFLIVLAGCGRKTAPKPYEADNKRKQFLPKITSQRTSFRGEGLKIDFTMPKSLILLQPEEEEDELEQTGKAPEKPEENKKTAKDKVEKYTAAMVRINLYHPNRSCSACEPDLIGRIKYSLDTEEYEISTDDAFTSQEEPLLIQRIKEYRFIVVIPKEGIASGLFDKALDISLDYITDEDDVSPPSQRMIPVQPKLIPQPEITIKKYKFVSLSKLNQITKLILGDKVTALLDFNEIPLPQKGFDLRTDFLTMNPSRFVYPLRNPTEHDESLIIIEDSKLDFEVDRECVPQRADYFLVLNWVQELETFNHILQIDGKIIETKRYYHVNLYGLDENEQEFLLTARPLPKTGFYLLNHQGDVYASFQDRRGNESERVLVFDGKY